LRHRIAAQLHSSSYQVPINLSDGIFLSRRVALAPGFLVFVTGWLAGRL